MQLSKINQLAARLGFKDAAQVLMTLAGGVGNTIVATTAFPLITGKIGASKFFLITTLSGYVVGPYSNHLAASLMTRKTKGQFQVVSGNSIEQHALQQFISASIQLGVTLAAYLALSWYYKGAIPQ
jgi:hypothetical protein